MYSQDGLDGLGHPIETRSTNLNVSDDTLKMSINRIIRKVSDFHRIHTDTHIYIYIYTQMRIESLFKGIACVVARDTLLTLVDLHLEVQLSNVIISKFFVYVDDVRWRGSETNENPRAFHYRGMVSCVKSIWYDGSSRLTIQMMTHGNTKTIVSTVQRRFKNILVSLTLLFFPLFCLSWSLWAVVKNNKRSKHNKRAKHSKRAKDSKRTKHSKHNKHKKKKRTHKSGAKKKRCKSHSSGKLISCSLCCESFLVQCGVNS